MEKRGTEIANVSQQVRPNVRPRFLSPEEIIARRRVTFGPNQRKAGVTEGTYKVTCDGCRGAGTVKFGTRPAEYCPKCGGVMGPSFPTCWYCRPAKAPDAKTEEGA